MKKSIALMLAILTILSLAACGKNAAKPEPKSDAPASDLLVDDSSNTAIGGDPATWGPAFDSNEVQIPSPFVDCDAMQDAEALCGFGMTAPDSIEGFPERLIQAVKDEMLQIFFKNDDKEILIRKAVGSEDISGDYSEYPETSVAAIGELSVTLKGEGGMVSVATWTDGGYTYAIDISGAGITAEAATALVQSVR